MVLRAMNTNATSAAEPDLITRDVAAYRLGVSLQKVAWLVKTGQLRAVKLGYRTIRIDRTSLDALIAK